MVDASQHLDRERGRRHVGTEHPSLRFSRYCPSRNQSTSSCGQALLSPAWRPSAGRISVDGDLLPFIEPLIGLQIVVLHDLGLADAELCGDAAGDLRTMYVTEGQLTVLGADVVVAGLAAAGMVSVWPG